MDAIIVGYLLCNLFTPYCDAVIYETKAQCEQDIPTRSAPTIVTGDDLYLLATAEDEYACVDINEAPQ